MAAGTHLGQHLQAGLVLGEPGVVVERPKLLQPIQAAVLKVLRGQRGGAGLGLGLGWPGSAAQACVPALEAGMQSARSSRACARSSTSHAAARAAQAACTHLERGLLEVAVQRLRPGALEAVGVEAEQALHAILVVHRGVVGGVSAWVRVWVWVG